MLFRLTGVLFRQHGSSGLGRGYSLYKDVCDAWCNMSWAVYLVLVDDIFPFCGNLVFRAIVTFAQFRWTRVTEPPGNEIGFVANNILLMGNWNHVLKRKMVDRFPKLPGSD